VSVVLLPLSDFSAVFFSDFVDDESEDLSDDDSAFLPLFLKSVSYQPVPFKTNAEAEIFFFRALSPQAGQNSNGSSAIFCNASSSCWQASLVQTYSYIGIEVASRLFDSIQIHRGRRFDVGKGLIGSSWCRMQEIQAHTATQGARIILQLWNSGKRFTPDKSIIIASSTRLGDQFAKLSRYFPIFAPRNRS
jgi:hypothetical protein